MTSYDLIWILVQMILKNKEDELNENEHKDQEIADRDDYHSSLFFIKK